MSGGEREEIPVRLQLPHPMAAPLLGRHARVLDFKAGGVSAENPLRVFTQVTASYFAVFVTAPAARRSSARAPARMLARP
jgi:hypothetical protein